LPWALPFRLRAIFLLLGKPYVQTGTSLTV
jgi:hypothetical protein